MHEASALVAGGTLDAARAVRSSARPSMASTSQAGCTACPPRPPGFCVYNDAAVAIAWLLADGVRRVAYVDLDAHHGDGVEAAFYTDPEVLTISLHESGYTAFPGTGFPQDSGGDGAEGTAVNVALPPETGDPGWLRAFHAVVPPLLRAFEPEILVSQLGSQTAIGWTRWRSSTSPSTRSGSPTRCCTSWRTSWPTAAGWRSAAAATRSSRSYPGHGPTCWPRSPAGRSTRKRTLRTAGAGWSRGVPVSRRPAPH